MGFRAQSIPYRSEADPNPTEIARLTSTWSQTTDKPNAADPQQLIAMKHAGVLYKTPVKYGLAPLGLDAHEPEWVQEQK